MSVPSLGPVLVGEQTLCAALATEDLVCMFCTLSMLEKGYARGLKRNAAHPELVPLGQIRPAGFRGVL